MITCAAAWLAIFLACWVRKCLEVHGKYWSTGVKFGINAEIRGAPAGVWVPDVLLGVGREGALLDAGGACEVWVPDVFVCAEDVWVPLLIGTPPPVAICVPESFCGPPALITVGLTWNPRPSPGKPIICMLLGWPWPIILICPGCPWLILICIPWGWPLPKAVWPGIINQNNNYVFLKVSSTPK